MKKRILICSIVISLIALFGAPARASAIVLYQQLTNETHSNFNWNAAPDNYAWNFTATATGVPTTLKVWNNDNGSAVATFCIKADKTAASASFGCVTGAALAAGQNTLTLTSGAQMTSGTQYWIYMTATANTPRINFKTTGASQHIWKSTASNIDPNSDWQVADVTMQIDGNAPAANTFDAIGLAGD